MTDRDRDRWIATHEAAHALLCELEGLGVVTATIVRGVSRNGLHYSGLVQPARPPRNARARIRVDVAGAIAERLVGADWRYVIDGGQADFANARRAAAGSRVDITEPVPAGGYAIDQVIALARVTTARVELQAMAGDRAELSAAVHHVERELLNHAEALGAIADALLELGTLTGADVRELIAAHPPREVRRDCAKDWSALIDALVVTN